MLNFSKLQDMQKAFERMQKELEVKEFVSDSLGIVITVSGNGEMRNISFAAADKSRFLDMQEDMGDIVMTVYKDACAKAEVYRNAQMSALNLPKNLPGMPKF